MRQGCKPVSRVPLQFMLQSFPALIPALPSTNNIVTRVYKPNHPPPPTARLLLASALSQSIDKKQTKTYAQMFIHRWLKCPPMFSAIVV